MLITVRSLSWAAPGRLVFLALFAALLTTAACSKGAANPQQAASEQAGAGGGGGAGRGGRAGGRAGGGGPVPVRTAHVEVKAMPVTIPAVGNAEPVTTVQVRAQVTGQLSQIHFAEGQDVRKGAPLFTLDSRPFEAALQQAEAILQRDTAQQKNAKAQLGRYEDLFKRGLIPRDQYDTQIATASALDATLAADQSQVENARLNLQYTKVMAPISGRTGTLGVHQGDLVRANDTTPMVIINQVSPIYVTFSVPGRFLPDIRQNQAKKPLKIEVRTKPGDAPGSQQMAPATPDGSKPPQTETPVAAGVTLNETGLVTFIDNTVDPTTGTIKLKGTFENADHGLWPGLFVQVTLLLSTDAKAIVVPAAAVQVSQTGQYVFVVKEDRTVDVRNVTVDRQQGEEMVIGKGLNAGEEVVTDGHLRLTAGARVSTGGGGGRGQGATGAEGGQDAGAPAGGGGNGRRGKKEGNQS